MENICKHNSSYNNAIVLHTLVKATSALKNNDFDTAEVDMRQTGPV